MTLMVAVSVTGYYGGGDADDGNGEKGDDAERRRRRKCRWGVEVGVGLGAWAAFAMSIVTTRYRIHCEAGEITLDRKHRV